MFVYPPGNDHIPYLRKRNIDSSSCLLGGDMLVPWRVDTSKLLVCSHRAGGTNVKDLSEVFLLHEFIVRKKFTNLHKETFSTPRVSYIHFKRAPKNVVHIFPKCDFFRAKRHLILALRGVSVSTRGKRPSSAFGRPFLCPKRDEKKEDGLRQPTLLRNRGERQGGFVGNRRLRTEKNAEKKS